MEKLHTDRLSILSIAYDHAPRFLHCIDGWIVTED
jgi:hypothetical protein